jgi:hypothetical protein
VPWLTAQTSSSLARRLVDLDQQAEDVRNRTPAILANDAGLKAARERRKALTPRRSLHDVAGELEEAGHLTSAGTRYAAAIGRMTAA